MSERRSRAAEGRRFLIDAIWFRKFVGAGLIAPWVRLVMGTNRKEFDPPDHLETSAALEPAIYLTWHANGLMQAVVARSVHRMVSLTSPHPDGRMAGALSAAMGVTTIVAEGAAGDKRASGGVSGFRAMLRALKEGRSLLLTGEVPPVPGRQVAPGIIAVARLSGRPIIPVGIASTRQTIIERLWDKMQINYPFGRMFIVSAPAIHVANGDDETEAAQRVKAALDGVYAAAMLKAEAARRR